MFIPVPSVFLQAVAIFICVALFSNLSNCGAATEKDIEADRILSSAEALFKSMKAKDYPLVWTELSKRSRDMIVASILSAERKRNVEHGESDIVNDLSSGGPLSMSYWNAYLARFDSTLVLDENSVVELAKLPALHRDPFDRMLICQALHNDLIIATVDSAVRAYSVRFM